jgi:hypothetical protein
VNGHIGGLENIKSVGADPPRDHSLGTPLDDELRRVYACAAGSVRSRIIHNLEIHRLCINKYIHRAAAKYRASRPIKIGTIGRYDDPHLHFLR